MTTFDSLSDSVVTITLTISHASQVVRSDCPRVLCRRVSSITVIFSSVNIILRFRSDGGPRSTVWSATWPHDRHLLSV